jgi:hypothetical protein
VSKKHHHADLGKSGRSYYARFIKGDAREAITMHAHRMDLAFGDRESDQFSDLAQGVGIPKQANFVRNFALVIIDEDFVFHLPLGEEP